MRFKDIKNLKVGSLLVFRTNEQKTWMGIVLKRPVYHCYNSQLIYVYDVSANQIRDWYFYSVNCHNFKIIAEI